MNEFNEHQVRLWKNMVDAVHKYMSKEISLEYLTTSLEGYLDAGEYKNKELINRWYAFWGPLERHNAVSKDTGLSSNYDLIATDVAAMLDFLEKQLS